MRLLGGEWGVHGGLLLWVQHGGVRAEPGAASGHAVWEEEEKRGIARWRKQQWCFLPALPSHRPSHEEKVVANTMSFSQ